MKSKVKIMMIGITALSLIGSALCSDAEFSEFMNNAKSAAGKGDFDNALTNYNSAFQAADKPELKAEALFAQNQFLLQNKKYADAEKLLKEFLQDETLAPLIRRRALNTLGRQIMWGAGRADEAKQYIDQAIAIPTENVKDQIEASITMGHIYTIKKQPENALEVWLPILEQRHAHLAYLSSVSYEIGTVYKQMNDIENARKYFQLAIDYGKQVKYKYDYSASEKALKELK